MGPTSSSSSFLPLLFVLCFLPSRLICRPIATTSIPTNFTASYLQFIDNSGAFLASLNGTFQARIFNIKPESRSFYFLVVHVLTHTVIWSANRNQPLSQSSQLRLMADGLALYNDLGHRFWSTGLNRSSVSSMQLLESGNLVLLDATENVLWESFDSPTDVLVLGQKLLLGKSLVSSLNDDEDISEGSYRLVIGDDDAFLQWNLMNYWKLTMEGSAFRDTILPVEYFVLNRTGVFLMGGNGGKIVVSVELNGDSFSSSDLQIVKLNDKGVLSVENIIGVDKIDRTFVHPADACRIPHICGKLSVCVNGGSCSCAPAFHPDPKTDVSDCVPTDSSLALPVSCNGSSSEGTNFKYLNLRNDLDYFSNEFTDPVIRNANLSLCQSICSRNCSCLGVFYAESSGSCYMIRNNLGSLFTDKSSNRSGYVKAEVVGSPVGSEEKKKDFPVIAAVLLPLSGIAAITIAATLVWMSRRRRVRRKRGNSKLGRANSSSSGEMDLVSITGLPVRFDYDELAEATQDFVTQIGSGGFGVVYRGTLQDGSDVAVKKITCLGSQGRREFLTEIAVIGKIHHVNLVRLKGFCAHGGQRLLVYEFMKRGSLDRTLFGGDPVLEWQERYEVALGTARGLAYLHSGCEHKIIHCDVKPENILLHDTSQVKISDFGLSKLLSPEQSGHFTTMRGTRGYLAPEWLTSSAISDKSDVYSYGMVILEIIRGKKNSSPQLQSNNNSSGTDQSQGGNANALSSPSSGESGHRLIYFPLFALEMHEEGRYIELVDPRLTGRVRSDEVEKLVRVALCCVHEDPNLRPSMSNVVGMLEGVVPLGEPRLESLNFLRYYGRRFTEASTLGDHSEVNEVMLYRQPTVNTTTTSSYNSLSYISSQQVSGPR